MYCPTCGGIGRVRKTYFLIATTLRKRYCVTCGYFWTLEHMVTSTAAKELRKEAEMRRKGLVK